MNATTQALNPQLFPPSQAPARTNRSNDGREFQKEIVCTADAYARAGVATLRKVDPPVRVMWLPDKQQPGKKVQRVIFQKNPYLDMLGVWTANGGRMLMLECKSTATHRLPFRREGGFTEEQFAAVQSWHVAGAAVALLWKFGERVALFTPEMMKGAEACGAKSLLFADGFGIPRGAGFVIWDFLPVMAARYTA